MPSFKDTLTRSIQALTKGTSYNVYDIKTMLTLEKPLYSNQKETPECTHRLILIAARPTTKGDTSPSDLTFCCGMEAFEYREKAKDVPLVIYISKVDSTGEFRQGGIARKLVQAYLTSQSEPCHVHVFARAQKQYLFARSADNPNKVFLSHRKLIAWWRTVLSDKSIWPHQDKQSTKGWWIMPGVDCESTALFDIGQKQIQDGDAEWCYGHPYDPQSIAKEVIPQFEDDPKARYLKTLLSDTCQGAESVSMNAFWDLLGYSEECRDGQSAIFVLHMNPTESKTPVNKDSGRVDRDTFSALWNDLMFRDFSTHKRAQTSTTEFIHRWRACLESSQYLIHTTGPTQRTDCLDPTQQSVPRESPAAVHTLTVRPKRKFEEPKVHVLSGSFIKRKKDSE